MDNEYTLKQCKKDMLYIWKWLAKTGKDKEDFLAFLSTKRAESTFNRFYDMNFNCPCCKFTGYKGLDGDNCQKCPINWKNNRYEFNAICDKRANEYYYWRTSKNHSEEKKAAALAILKLAEAIDLQKNQ